MEKKCGRVTRMKIEDIHKCPYCGYMYRAALGQNTYSNIFAAPGGSVAVHSMIHVCPHVACGKTEVTVEAGSPPASSSGKGADRQRVCGDLGNAFFSARLLPLEACGKPEFKTAEVPEAVFHDYDQACRLLKTSPCASATYARRCLQGMVRKKFKLKPGKFQNEIKTLASMNGTIRQEVIDALENVRKIGKFRAMPEDDVKVLVDVNYGEARQTIEVIEALLFDWFLAPAEREKRAEALKAIIEGKKQ
jgi:rubredoxin